MAVLSTLVLDSSLTFGKKNQITISGTVTDGTNPLSRTVIALAYPIMFIPIQTTSLLSDGAWSLTLNVGPVDRILVVVLGEAGENSEIFDWITS